MSNVRNSSTSKEIPSYYAKVMISANIVADSVAPNGKRITTFVLRYPRFVHAELMTHRLFSRNVASSRAIPVEKFIKRVWSDPAMPVFWGKNKPGMMADEELTGWRLWVAKRLWVLECWMVLLFGKLYSLIGLHKQIANRPAEAWFYVETILTATEFGNWYNLRLDAAAQPEIRRLADVMLRAHNASVPIVLQPGEWHLPFVSEYEKAQYRIEDCIKFSIARCARVSYLNHDGSNPNMLKDLGLANRLYLDGHMSPFEHQATPAKTAMEWSGNFQGWTQYRKTLPKEHRPYYSGLK